MKIGIFGGSFNPPHKAHLQIVKDIINQRYVDKVIFVPTGDKYKKDDLIPNKHRYEMLKIITQDEKYISVSNFEQHNQSIYIYQTLDYFKSLFSFDDIYLICRSDNLDTFSTWKRYEYILENYHLIVTKRGATSIPKELEKYKDRITLVDANYNISSTIIRNKLLNEDNREILRRHLDRNVLEYIRKENLYGRKNI